MGWSPQVVRATEVIISGTGDFLLVYNGPPAHGNLTASIAPAAGTDLFGNAYRAGIWSYGSSGSAAGLATSGTDAVLFLVPGGATQSTALPLIFSAAVNPGLVNEIEDLIMTSGNAGHDDAALQLFSAAADNTVAARAVVEFGGSVAMQVTKTNTTFTTGAGTGISGTPAITQTDNAVDTNANNGTQPMTKTWTIPANDAQVGTEYLIETNFSGTFQTATLGFKPRLSANPTMTTSGGDVIAGTFFTAGDGFAGDVAVKMRITATGAGGTADFFVDGGIGSNANRSPGVKETYLSSQATAQAIDTTVANTLVIVSVWGSSVASQTVSARGSTLTRRGP